MRKTRTLAAVAAALLAAPNDKHWGYDIGRATGTESGAIYPLLARLHDAGWLSASWEAPQDTVSGRPPRRYYELTAAGKRELRNFLRNDPKERN